MSGSDWDVRYEPGAEGEEPRYRPAFDRPDQPYGYAVVPVPPYTQPAQTNGLAVASLVLGILWIWWIGSALALIFGYVAKSQIDSSHGRQSGRGLAIAGIVLGWVGAATFMFFIFLLGHLP